MQDFTLHTLQISIPWFAQAPQKEFPSTWDVPFFIRTPPKDGKFLHKGGRIFKSKEPPKKLTLRKFFTKVPPKNEPFRFFSSKGAAKTLRGRNPAILREGGVRIKNGTTPCAYQQCSSFFFPLSSVSCWSYTAFLGSGLWNRKSNREQ